MHVSPCDTLSHFLFWECAGNLTSCMKFESCFWYKWHGVNHNGLVYTLWRSSKHSHICTEGYETRNQQWMSLFAAHCPISGAERVPEIWNITLFTYAMWYLSLSVMIWCGPEGVIVCAIRSSSNHHYTSKEKVRGTYKQQVMSFLATQHFISRAERMPEI